MYMPSEPRLKQLSGNYVSKCQLPFRRPLFQQLTSQPRKSCQMCIFERGAFRSEGTLHVAHNALQSCYGSLLAKKWLYRTVHPPATGAYHTSMAIAKEGSDQTPFKRHRTATGIRQHMIANQTVLGHSVYMCWSCWMAEAIGGGVGVGKHFDQKNYLGMLLPPGVLYPLKRHMQRISLCKPTFLSLLPKLLGAKQVFVQSCFCSSAGRDGTSRRWSSEVGTFQKKLPSDTNL